MNIWLYIKLAAGAGLLFWAYHLGGNASRAALEADHAAMATAATKALLAQAAQAAADHASQQRVIDAYDATKDIPDPASVGTAHRVLLLAAGAGDCPVPEAAAVAGGAPRAPAVTIGPSEVERRLDDYIQACGEDTKLLRTVQALAPK
jgi:hypothetical protein